MKIKDGFIISEIADESLLVPTDGAFGGVVRINDTAKFIIECLQEETTKKMLLINYQRNMMQSGTNLRMRLTVRLKC